MVILIILDFYMQNQADKTPQGLEPPTFSDLMNDRRTMPFTSILSAYVRVKDEEGGQNELITDKLRTNSLEDNTKYHS